MAGILFGWLPFDVKLIDTINSLYMRSFNDHIATAIVLFLASNAPRAKEVMGQVPEAIVILIKAAIYRYNDQLIIPGYSESPEK